jgi:hypothetical protein
VKTKKKVKGAAKADSPKKRYLVMRVEKSKAKTETVYLVIQETQCRETFVTRESVVDVVKHKAVAEFRAGGANLFAEKGSTDRCFVRPIEMICEETPEEFLKNRMPTP